MMPWANKWYNLFKHGRKSVECFFNSRGIMPGEDAKQDQTIDKEYYLDIISHLHDAERGKLLWGKELATSPRQCAHSFPDNNPNL